MRSRNPRLARAASSRAATFIEDATKNGRVVSGTKLQTSPAGARVRVSRRITMTDGPFIETKELLGGDAITDATPR